MQEFLSKMVGRRLDIYCLGAANLRGEVLKVDGGILHLRDEDEHTAYVPVDKIVVVWEARDDEPKAGFVAPRAETKRVGFKKEK